MTLLSLVIPTYSPIRELMEMALVCASSYRDQVDELIITEDSNTYWPELHAIADHYLLHRENLQHCLNTNAGWKLAKGAYVAIANSDTYLIEGNLKDLCVPDTVTSPAIPAFLAVGGNYNTSGAFFVVPRSVFEKHGMFSGNQRWLSGDTLTVHYYPSVGVQGKRIDSVKVFHDNASIGRSYRVRGTNEDICYNEARTEDRQRP